MHPDRYTSGLIALKRHPKESSCCSKEHVNTETSEEIPCDRQIVFLGKNLKAFLLALFIAFWAHPPILSHIQNYGFDDISRCKQPVSHCEHFVSSVALGKAFLAPFPFNMQLHCPIYFGSGRVSRISQFHLSCGTFVQLMSSHCAPLHDAR